MNTPSENIINSIRAQFPALGISVGKHKLVYLDNTATSQTPQRVVEAIDRAYYNTKANVHRGVHTLSQQMTLLQEEAREKARAFINAPSVQEIIFTRGTTEAINLVASCIGRDWPDGAEVIVTEMEHHSNIVPWQLLSRPGREIKLRVVPTDERGVLDMNTYRNLFNSNTAMVAATHVSNVLGTVNPVKEIAAEARAHGVPVLIDGAQAISHRAVDVQDIGADFYAFSAHKMYGPTGVGILYGRRDLLEQMPPYQGGGEMVGHVTFQKTTYAELPFKFEAGTPEFTSIAALSQAIDFINETGYDLINAQEEYLLQYTTGQMLKRVPGLRLFGTAPGKDAIISFLIGRAHHYDTGLLLDKLGIAVRTGHHCAQPLMQALGVEGVVRASFAVYNTRAEADYFVDALCRIAPMLQ